MKTVLLTGHLGFIGKNLYTSLTRSGYNVLGIEKDFIVIKIGRHIYIIRLSNQIIYFT